MCHSVWQCVVVCCIYTCDTLHTCFSAICAAVCGRVWQCVTVCGGVWQCVAVCGSVWQCVAVCGSVWQCVAVCGSMLFVCTRVTHLTHVWVQYALLYVSQCVAECGRCGSVMQRVVCIHKRNTPHTSVSAICTAVRVAVCCIVWQCVAVCCIHTCNTLDTCVGTAHCIWSVISRISKLNRSSSSLRLFCHVPLKTDQ